MQLHQASAGGQTVTSLPRAFNIRVLTRSVQALQEAQLGRLGRELPLEQLRLPFIFRSDLSIDALQILSDALTSQIAALAGVVAPT